MVVSSRTVYACSQMLLTLTATSLRSMLKPGRSGRPKLELLDLPAFARQTLGLHGLNLSTRQLAGMDHSGLEEIRERGDKEGCACLLLFEPEPQALGSADASEAEAACDRAMRVVEAASILGCNSAAITPLADGSDESLDRTAEALKRVMARAERRELNILISPGNGLTKTPERVTALLKKVGGFRVGTMPDFGAAAAADDPAAYLRRLTPYATVVTAATSAFTSPGGGPPDKFLDAPLEHKSYALRPMVEAVLSVGFDGTMAVDYRGRGDATLGIQRSRAILERLIEDVAGKK